MMKFHVPFLLAIFLAGCGGTEPATPGGNSSSSSSSSTSSTSSSSSSSSSSSASSSSSGRSVPFSISGVTDIHDPSTIIKDGDRYWTFGTGNGAGNSPILARSSTDLMNWRAEPSPIPRNTVPAWISEKVPGFDGNFWAPDLIQMNGRFYLYYSAFSASSGMRSAIGVMVSDSLNNPNWRDLGMVVSTVDEPRSSRNEPVNAIDPGLYRDTDDKVWMVYGSHYAGIYIVQIDPQTGKRADNQRYQAAGGNGGWNEYEAAQVQYLDGYYYLFINLGHCCDGRNSNYIMFVGRSQSPTGPFLTRDGRDMWQGDVLSQQEIDNGVTRGSVLSTQGVYIGPGHFGYLNNQGQHLASIHHYDGTTSTGWPGRLRLLELTLVDGWPELNYEFLLRQ